MRIGLSYSRCVRDIVEGNVNIDDVLVIICRTKFDPTIDEHWTTIWDGYRSRNGLSNPEWFNFPDRENDFRSVTLDLWRTGKMHQPRLFGAYPSRFPHIWLEAFLPSEELAHNVVVKDAWEKFLILANLTNVELKKDDVA